MNKGDRSKVKRNIFNPRVIIPLKHRVKEDRMIVPRSIDDGSHRRSFFKDLQYCSSYENLCFEQPVVNIIIESIDIDQREK